MRRVLDTIVDLLTLAAIAVAAAGHFFTWMQPSGPLPLDAPWDLAELQRWYASRSGIALGVAALLVCLSLLINWKLFARKVLVLLLFASLLAALGIQVVVFSDYPLAPGQDTLQEVDLRFTSKYLLAFIPTGVAGALTLLRMTWTMPASGRKRRGREWTTEEADLVEVPLR